MNEIRILSSTAGIREPRADQRPLSSCFILPAGDAVPPAALVTGAGSGIGRAVATALAARGVHVVVACRTLAGARAVAASIRVEHPNASVEAAVGPSSQHLTVRL